MNKGRYEYTSMEQHYQHTIDKLTIPLVKLLIVHIRQTQVLIHFNKKRSEHEIG